VHRQHDPTPEASLDRGRPHEQFVASPVYSEKTGLFYITRAASRPSHHGIRPDGDGDVTGRTSSGITTTAPASPYVPSPIIEGDWFLVTDDRGVRPASYEDRRHRLNEKFGRSHASIVSAAACSFSMTPAPAGRETRGRFRRVATNDLGEHTTRRPRSATARSSLRTEKPLLHRHAKSRTSAVPHGRCAGLRASR